MAGLPFDRRAARRHLYFAERRQPRAEKLDQWARQKPRTALVAGWQTTRFLLQSKRLLGDLGHQRRWQRAAAIDLQRAGERLQAGLVAGWHPTRLYHRPWPALRDRSCAPLV